MEEEDYRTWGGGLSGGGVVWQISTRELKPVVRERWCSISVMLGGRVVASFCWREGREDARMDLRVGTSAGISPGGEPRVFHAASKEGSMRPVWRRPSIVSGRA